MIRQLVLTNLIAFFSLSISAQTVYELPINAIDLYPTLEDMYGYAVGKVDQYYLVFGGSIRSDASEQYQYDFPNLEILMIDTNMKRASAFTNGNLEGSLGEQMSATGLSYYQEGSTLYLLGGYGFSESNNQFITFPYITAIDLDATIKALKSGENPVANFYQICDERIAIFDGVLDYNGDEFFLMNGKHAYKLRPFANDAEYIEESHKGEARTFKISKDGEQLKIDNFQNWYDMDGLREYYGPLLPERINTIISPEALPEQ